MCFFDYFLNDGLVYCVFAILWVVFTVWMAIQCFRKNGFVFYISWGGSLLLLISMLLLQGFMIYKKDFLNVVLFLGSIGYYFTLLSTYRQRFACSSSLTKPTDVPVQRVTDDPKTEAQTPKPEKGPFF